VKLAVVSVALVIGSEKVADTEEFRVTPVALLAGEVLDTWGGVVSGAAPLSPPLPHAAMASRMTAPATGRTMRLPAQHFLVRGNPGARPCGLEDLVMSLLCAKSSERPPLIQM